MRKTSFFYVKKIVFLLCLVWLALLNEAVSLNLSKKQEEVQTIRENTEKIKKETVEAENQAAQKEGENQKEDQVSFYTETDSENVKVLLMDSDFESYFHPEVILTYRGNEISYTPDSPQLQDGPVTLTSEEGIVVSSIKRQEGAPRYTGKITIEARKEGLLLINELPMEEYLKGVVPSEMPSSYPEEALKAQAVCARTYAWKQINEKRLKEYGADVDDSVNFQVYQNIFPQESTTMAVEKTKGEVLCQNGELIEAYYFSTSAGATSTDEVWGAKEAASYLKSVPCTFDSQETWSSWEVQIPWTQLQAETRDYTGTDATLKNIEITKKNQSGAVIGLHVVTDQNSFDLSQEYEIREFLSPSGCTITGKDGSSMTGGNLLLSAYFSMDILPGESVQIHGKGYGHGVGMSQNAAKTMAEQGYSYGEILDYFFQDVEIQQAADLNG